MARAAGIPKASSACCMVRTSTEGSLPKTSRVFSAAAGNSIPQKRILIIGGTSSPLFEAASGGEATLAVPARITPSYRVPCLEICCRLPRRSAVGSKGETPISERRACNASLSSLREADSSRDALRSYRRHDLYFIPRGLLMKRW